ncbi:hypothetical protein DFH28DRAFT_1120236 [Melampsora americana]|nr:hypothetical protein DFH28DRAFT_1120236 [Melampsora americana]
MSLDIRSVKKKRNYTKTHEYGSFSQFAVSVLPGHNPVIGTHAQARTANTRFRGHESASTITNMDRIRKRDSDSGFLSFMSVAVTLSVIGQFLVSILQSLSGAHLLSVEWRIRSALLNHLPGIFLVPAQLIQSWRIFSEKSASDEANIHMIPMDFKNREIPQMASQLLGWDTTIYWDQEA